MHSVSTEMSKAPCLCLLVEKMRHTHNSPKRGKEGQEWHRELSAAGVVRRAASLLVVVICQVREKQVEMSSNLVCKDSCINQNVRL